MNWSSNNTAERTWNRAFDCYQTCCSTSSQNCITRLRSHWTFDCIMTQTAAVKLRGLNPLKPSGHYMYRQFNMQQFYVLPTLCIYVFCVYLRTAIISLYSINWLVFITETECVYCAVRTVSLYIILHSAHTVYLCVFCGSQNKHRLFLYTTLTYRFLKPKQRVFTARYELGL